MYFSLASCMLNIWINFFLVFVCVWMWGQVCQGMCVKVPTEFSGGGSFFPSLVAGLNSDFQAYI